MPAAPVRTCIGCRRPEGKAVLLRVVIGSAPTSPGTDWVVQPDPARRLPGRGAYVHPTGECVEQAVRRRAFGRALRREGKPDVRAVEDYLARQ